MQSKDKDGAMHRVQNDAAYTSLQSNQKAVSHALTGGWWGISCKPLGWHMDTCGGMPGMGQC